MVPRLLLDTKISKNGPKQYNKLLLFARRAKKALAKGQNPPQELEVGPRRGPCLLVYLNILFLHYLTKIMAVEAYFVVGECRGGGVKE